MNGMDFEVKNVKSHKYNIMNISSFWIFIIWALENLLSAHKLMNIFQIRSLKFFF